MGKNKTRIVSIVGARPQFVKAAMISVAMKAFPEMVEVLVHTGQHYDRNMSGIFLEELNVLPDYNLNIGSGSHGVQTGRMLEAIERVLLIERPNWVIVYGDTNSTLAGALAAVKLHIPLGHVEAGLRSFNRIMPEEINRVLTDHASTLLFAPTETAVKNLRLEGIPEDRIKLVGDVMYDAAIYYGAKAEERSIILDKLGLVSKRFVLVTIHRAENTGNPDSMKAIFEGIAKVAKELPVVLPLHPRTKAALKRIGFLNHMVDKLKIIEPVGYLDMVMLEKNAALIATDSGGVQKEAFFYKVPCVTLREETEWVELVEHKWNILVKPYSAEEISRIILMNLSLSGLEVFDLFGNGNASQNIINIISSSAL